MKDVKNDIGCRTIPRTMAVRSGAKDHQQYRQAAGVYNAWLKGYFLPVSSTLPVLASTR
jgi:hypothetical protein